jgi:plasmid maintenance system antidote protein VapI
MARYRLDRQRGQQRRIDSTTARATITPWLNAGWSYTALAALIGCSDTVIVDLVAGKPRLNAATAERIQRLPAQPGQPVGRSYTDGTGTIRRARALVRIGYRINVIAKEIDIHPDALSRLINRDESVVLVSTALAMSAAYKRWAWRPGPCKQARSRAQRLGWHGPMAWDADTIDDPAAQPDTEGEGADEARKRNNDRPAEIKHLAGFGFSAHTIGRQVGLPEKDVEGRIAKLHAERNRKQVAA